MWKRHGRYASDGTWDRALAQILADADAAGDIDWNVSVDGKGRPLAIMITGGQRHDGVILADIRVPRVGPGRARTLPDSVLADRAYGSRANREYLRARVIRAVIPGKSTQITARKNRGNRGGRRPAFNAVAYRNRNVVERSFAYAKQWRGLATRYDKLAIVYRAAVLISAILMWLNR